MSKLNKKKYGPEIKKQQLFGTKKYHKQAALAEELAYGDDTLPIIRNNRLVGAFICFRPNTPEAWHYRVHGSLTGFELRMKESVPLAFDKGRNYSFKMKRDK